LLRHWLEGRYGCYYHQWNTFETIGSGAVFFFDGRKIEQSNIADIEEGSPFSVQNLVVHIMENSNRYELNTHSFEMDSHYKINP
jgi:cyanophycinase-like exopeptidase